MDENILDYPNDTMIEDGEDDMDDEFMTGDINLNEVNSSDMVINVVGDTVMKVKVQREVEKKLTRKMVRNNPMLNEAEKYTNEFVRDMVTKMKQKFDKYWGYWRTSCGNLYSSSCLEA